ncbi:GntP family transporter [Microbacterium sp. KSW2-29]|uniref:GntP family transporter n=1 Tax=Microbacterium phycohabitans TaxID=3075993 RepID=A0ABU3SL27_9MICO|nr:GntP family transporter [Microbacterium sp. KSW2-29]MDU0345494.1 GntP family transporter [Microbacterium sp. KSW2-29]
MSTPVLLAIGVGGILLLLLLIIRLKLNAFLALLIVSIIVGLAAGLPLATVPATEDTPEKLGVVPAIVAGLGSTVGSIAILITLGAMLGRIIELSGGASSLAGRFTEILGPKRVGAALTGAALVLAIPVFFDVGFIILVPIVYGFAQAAGLKPLRFGLPVAGIMLAVHVSVPPHPGVVGGAALLGADIGWLTIVGILIAIPLAFVSHLLSKRLTRREFDMLASTEEMFEQAGRGGVQTTVTGTVTSTIAPPSAGMVLTLIVTPLIMIGIGTTAATVLPSGDPVRNIAQFIGAPLFALLVTVLLAIYFLGVRRKWGRDKISDVLESALPPTAAIILVSGAGGAFARVLTESGIGSALSSVLLQTGLPVLVLAFVVSLALRAAQGSATVAILTTAGLLTDTVANGGFSMLQIVAITLAIAFGALGLSHVNDSGFWVVTRYLGLSVGDGLRTWTVLTTVLGVCGFALVAVFWGIATAVG